MIGFFKAPKYEAMTLFVFIQYVIYYIKIIYQYIEIRHVCIMRVVSTKGLVIYILVIN